MTQENPKLFDHIERQLAVEPFTVDGVLKKYVVINRAQNGDETLLKLLLESEVLKNKFFKQVAGALVFDHRAFVWFLEQKNYLNDSYTRYKNKIGLTVDGKYLKQRAEVALAWPFKDCYLEGGQSREEQKRDEIFYNEVLAPDEITQLLWPKALTAAAVYDKIGKRAFKNFARDDEANKKRDLPAGTITDNLLVKGNNLLALHSLKKKFTGKVKLIYIDPPYNTGGRDNTFTYNNNFNHSTWLTFMRNRLDVAKDMLRDDGFIAIAIDHAELFYLGVLADEVFGRENRLGIISVVIKPEGRQFAKFVSVTNDYMLIYAKDANATKFNDVVLDEHVQEKFDHEDERGKFSLRQYVNYNPVEVCGRHVKPRYWYPVYFDESTGRLSLVAGGGGGGGPPPLFPPRGGKKKIGQPKKKKTKKPFAKKNFFGKKERPGTFVFF